MQTIHDHGFVKLIDHMPRENMDQSIVQAARVSYGDGTTTTRGDRGLIRYLIRHWHTSPFEYPEFKFHIKCPIFIARQMFRHRTASVNEVSARYSVVPEEYYEPKVFRGQSETNKQGSDGIVNISTRISTHLEDGFKLYRALLDEGVCREQARIVLPQATYTEFYFKMDLHNLMHFLHLRMDAHAQEEIRDYANAIHDLIQPLVPVTMEAFKDFRLDAIQLSGPEIHSFKTKEPIESPGERREFEDKLKYLV
jgi:thymidylate synthase (FAD)